MQNEAKLKAHLRQGFKESFPDGVWAAIVSSQMQRSGLPDIFSSANGMSAWIEAKVNGNKLRGMQEKLIPQMRRNGAIVKVISCSLLVPTKDRILTIDSGACIQYISWDLVFSPSIWSKILC